MIFSKAQKGVQYCIFTRHIKIGEEKFCVEKVGGGLALELKIHGHYCTFVPELFIW